MDVLKAIPHRPPFLLIDRIIAADNNSIKTEATTRKHDELFSKIYAGHFPQQAITPGTLLCEMVFQSGAVLLSKELESSEQVLPVLVKIKEARFRKMIPPNATLEIEVNLKEYISNVFYMKGVIKHEGDIAVRVEFACALYNLSKSGTMSRSMLLNIG